MEKRRAMSKLEPAVDLSYPTEAHGRIPAFSNIEERAEFWDTHDFTDFLDKSRSIELIVGPSLTGRFVVRPELQGVDLGQRTEQPST